MTPRGICRSLFLDVRTHSEVLSQKCEIRNLLMFMTLIESPNFTYFDFVLLFSHVPCHLRIFGGILIFCFNLFVLIVISFVNKNLVSRPRM